MSAVGKSILYLSYISFLFLFLLVLTQEYDAFKYLENLLVEPKHMGQLTDRGSTHAKRKIHCSLAIQPRETDKQHTYKTRFDQKNVNLICLKMYTDKFLIFVE